MGSYLYAIIIYPLEMFIETVFSISMDMIDSAGYAIIFVSLAVQLLVLPMYKRADELQEEERMRQKEMAPAVKHIRKTFKGDERVMMLNTYYRHENYHMYHQLRAILPLMLQIPFFMAAYNFLSECPALDGASFYFLKDMGRPDGILNIGGFAVNVMPIAMTLINIVSGAIYTRGLQLKDKLQLYITAGVFLVLLYDSPSGLVFYWTLNNVFSLLKNIFMKLVKHPRAIADIAAIVFVLAYCYKCISRGAWETSSGRIVIIMVLAIGFIPAIGFLMDKYGKVTDTSISDDENVIFRLSGVVLAVTLGILIPVATIASSPNEFVVRGHYVNPLVQVVYSFLVAAGLFVLWGNIIFNFYSARAKKIMCFAVIVLMTCGLVNSQFFRQGLNNMSMNMIYYDGFGYDISEKLINLAILTAVGIVILAVYRINKKVIIYISAALAGVVTVMSVVNIYKIQTTLNRASHIKDDDYYINSDATYYLDKTGKNVIVLFEDRAFGPFLPYIINEKPELAKSYSGFTYYKNTLSHGTCTIEGAPALCGGYEYTSRNIHDKGDDVRDESTKVMPTIFAQNGFVTTVMDKPNFTGLYVPSIEDFYKEADPSINAYYADGVVKTKEEADRDYAYFEKSARSNFIRHSIFLSSPLLLRSWLYDGGWYLMQTHAEDRITFAGHIEELDKLSDMITITDTGTNTFSFIGNNTTHSMDVNLQMPEYTLEDTVDNSDYIEKWREKLSDTPGDRGLNTYTDLQIQGYEVNMAAHISICKWLDYLKENDLYDNSRIIIVADHGYSYNAFDDMLMDNDGQITDLDMFTPLLMVKDFADAPGNKTEDELVTSNEFMTNADVPLLAMEGLIDNPVNPFTSNPITDENKKQPFQYVFDDQIWLTVHDDVNDINNWDVLNDSEE